MTIRFSNAFLRQYPKLPQSIRKKTDTQVKYLAQNLRHPGLHARKMTKAGDIWEARIDEHYRMTFQIEGDTILIRKVGTHEIYRNP